MNTKHTPGPWEYDAELITFRSPENDGDEDALAMLMQPNCPESGEDEEIRQMEANGKLIAASPDLLEVVARLATSGWLAGVAPEKDSNDPVAALLALAHAALEKACGQSQHNDQGHPVRTGSATPPDQTQ